MDAAFFSYFGWPQDEDTVILGLHSSHHSGQRDCSWVFLGITHTVVTIVARGTVVVFSWNYPHSSHHSGQRDCSGFFLKLPTQ